MRSSGAKPASGVAGRLRIVLDPRNGGTPAADTIGMSAPRQILPGSTYLVTRRCTQRQFWLKPTRLTTQIVAYCVAYAAAQTRIQLHAVCVLSNHWHAVVTDPDARLPEFLHWVHRHIAACVNASYGRWENLWASEPAGAVRLMDDADILDKIAYCLANPVAAGLVRRGVDWPGLRSLPRHVAGHRTTVHRPTVYFRDQGRLPETVELELVPPPAWRERSAAEIVRSIEAAVEEKEARARRVLDAQGRAFLGVRAVLKQPPSDRPQTCEPRRGLSPRIAAANKWLRIEALRRLEDFLRAYREALAHWKRGLRSVLFPPGTYAVRVYQGALVASPG
jgi:REP element-mobilizing transposase RayT